MPNPTRGERLAGWWAIPGTVFLALWVLEYLVGGVGLTYNPATTPTPVRAEGAVLNSGTLQFYRLRLPFYEGEISTPGWHVELGTEMDIRLYEPAFVLGFSERMRDFPSWDWVRGLMYRLGFHIRVSEWGSPSGTGAIMVSLPGLVLAFAGPWGWYRLKRWRLAAVLQASSCPDCGYDVRGLERGCPECGLRRGGRRRPEPAEPSPPAGDG